MPTALQQIARSLPPETALPGFGACLEALYRRYTTPDHAANDPVRFLSSYPDPAEREIVGLIAAVLAYGRVAQILRSVGWVLDRLGPNPAKLLCETSDRDLLGLLEGFAHRFQKAEHLAALLGGIGRVQRRYGSLEACFAGGLHPRQRTGLFGLAALRQAIDPAGRCGHLLPNPASGSACKRLHLFLRWMVRRDAVDPGGWTCLGPDRLLLPMDVHLHRWCRRLGATDRAAADLPAALQATGAFAALCPDDPVRYDFALAHAGMADPATRP